MSAPPAPVPDAESLGQAIGREAALDLAPRAAASPAHGGPRHVPLWLALAGCAALSLASGAGSALVVWGVLRAPEAAALTSSPAPAAPVAPHPMPARPARVEALLLAALALEDAARGSAPFAGELAYAMRAAGRDAELLAPLDRLMGRAETGVPSGADLLARFGEVAAEARAAAKAGRPGLADRATLLMRDAALRVGVGTLPAGDPAAAVDRAARALAQGRLDAARAELAVLPPGAAAAGAVAAWVGDAGARVEADAAAREFRQLAIQRALR